MENVTFINNHSLSGSIIYGEYITNKYNNKFIILDSYFSGKLYNIS